MKGHTFAVSGVAPGKVATGDTLFPLSFYTLPCASDHVVYQSNNGGYVLGNNGWGDLAKAQKFHNFDGMAGVTEFLVWFGGKSITNPVNEITVTIHAADQGNGPGSQIAESRPLALGLIDTTGGPTVFTFASPIYLSDSFFVSVNLPTTAGDTVGIVSSEAPCALGDNLWEKFENGDWHSFMDSLSWGLAMDMVAAPVMEFFATGQDEILADWEGLKLYGLAPNPALERTELRVGLANTAEIKVSLLDLQGRAVRDFEFGSLSAGNHQLPLEIQGLQSGTYLYVVQAGDQRLAGKLNILH